VSSAESSLLPTPSAPSSWLADALSIARYHILLIAMTAMVVFGWLMTEKCHIALMAVVGLCETQARGSAGEQTIYYFFSTAGGACFFAASSFFLFFLLSLCFWFLSFAFGDLSPMRRTVWASFSRQQVN